MSVRAYRIKHIEAEAFETFNLWHNDELVDLLDVYEKNGLNTDGVGIIEFGLDELTEALEIAEQEKTKEILRKMITDVKASKDGEYIKYECY